MSAIERLLVRLPNWLGDVLLARPLLHALRRAHPAAESQVVGPAPLLELLAAERTFDLAAPWPREAAGRAALARRIRAWRPAAAIVLPPSFSSALLAWRSGAQVRIGYGHGGRAFLLTHAPRRPPRGDLHLSREYLALGEPLGIAPVPVPAPVPRLEPSAAGREAALALLRARGLADRPYAVLGPGAIYGPAKRWSSERFVAVGRDLVRRGLGVAVSGTAAEREGCEAVASGIGAGAISLAGATDLAAQAALCAAAAVALCNDSGLAHLAAATGAPTVVVFGSTSSAWTAPLGDRVRVVQHAPVCSPCFRRTCRIGYGCLAAVEAGEVARACAELVA